VQLSENRRLREVLNDPVLQGPGMRAIVVVHDGRIVAETHGEGFTASTPFLGWSVTKTIKRCSGCYGDQGWQAFARSKKFVSQWAGDARADISVADLPANGTIARTPVLGEGDRHHGGPFQPRV
jgi:hypothetical protein